MNDSLHGLLDCGANWNASCDARKYYPMRAKNPAALKNE
ncbi:MAG: hypothetical protein QOI59_5535 [Gammaproteobacteria bacterium]|jgi:hypothetical protein|nr:hypothetical protein [Gammaproteobacteria bacterium]